GRRGGREGGRVHHAVPAAADPGREVHGPAEGDGRAVEEDGVVRPADHRRPAGELSHPASPRRASGPREATALRSASRLTGDTGERTPPDEAAMSQLQDRIAQVRKMATDDPENEP